MLLLEFLFCRTGFVIACIGSAVGMEIVSGWMYAVSIYICPLGAMLAAIMFFCAFFISFAIIITDIFNKKYKKKCYMTAKENINIRLAEEKDIDSVIKLLTQVLNIHAKIRPDIFIGGTTKYTKEELMEIFNDANRPVYVAVDENDSVMGYAFCIKKKQPFSTNMVPFDSLFIDDLCVDQNIRGKHVGQKIFEHVKEEAKKMGCYDH